MQPDTTKDQNGTAEEDDPIFGSLKRLYDEVACEPLPEDLMRLLMTLDEAERNR